jgi:hypothetical protein
VALVKTVRLNIVTAPGDSRAKMEAIDRQARKLGELHPEIKVKIDSAAALLQLSVLKHELKNTGTESETLSGKFRNLSRSMDQALPKFSGLAAAGLSLGPALLPVLAAATAATLGLGTALAGAGAALGIFGAAAKSNLADMEKQLKKVQAANLLANKALAVKPGDRTATQKAQIADAKAMTAAFDKEFGALATAQEKLKKVWDSFKNQGGVVNNTLAQGMNLIAAALPHFTPLLRLGATAVQAFEGALAGFTVGGGLDRMVAGLVKFGKIGLAGLLAVLHNLAVAFGALSGGMGSFAQGAINGIVGLSRAFADWAQNKGSGALTGLMETVKRLGPGVAALLQNLAAVLPTLARGLFPLAPLSLALSTALAGIIAKVPPGVITALAVAFLSVYGAIKLVTTATKVWEGVQAVMNVLLDANPIGLIVLGLAALVTGIVLAYQHSETFRKIVQASFRVVLAVVQAVWGWIKKNWPLLLAVLTGPIGLLATFVIKHFDTIKSVISAAIKIIKLTFLTMIDNMLGGLRNLTGTLGHLPGPLGAPFRAMSGAIDHARDRIHALMDSVRGVHGKSVKILVGGSGHWDIVGPGGPGHRVGAKGLLVTGGVPGRDSVPILAMPGEAVVPKHLTPAIAPFLAANRVPGFARGGVVGSYADGPAGLGRFLGREYAATERAIELGVVAAIRGAQKAGAGFGGGSGALGGDAGANKSLASRIFPWGSSQWPPFVALEMREAGFNRFARNPSSGAYGIPQALPPTKMPFAAQAAGGSHAGPQLSWMFNYIKGRYSTPAGAWAHEVSAGWYDRGGVLPRGLSLALNTTGRPEPVGAAITPTVVIRVGGSGHGTLDRAVLSWLKRTVVVEGGGDVQVALGGT